MATSFWSPYESSPTTSLALSAMPNSARHSRARCRTARSTLRARKGRKTRLAIPSPGCPGTATATLSSTVICSQMRTSWNERAMPLRATSTTDRLVMSSPCSTTVPSSGFMVPVIMLKIVVLPAPLGPIRAVILPSGIVNDAPPTATSPPKLFLSPVTSSADAPSAPCATVTRESRTIASSSEMSSASPLPRRRPKPSGMSPCGRTSIMTTSAPP
ncbi:unannotated protein [freshwater metagenome]|uniref:Unannotated protein n=1 Tax=freshwater metagenome TaxID=449393 RepID=A0A6J7QB86_9ZZZZ